MARTKASVGSKVSSFKSSKARCSAAPAMTNSSSAGGSDRQSKGASGGGNPVCPRETPKWQKPITNFFICKDEGSNEQVDVEDSEAGTSSVKTHENATESTNGNIPEPNKANNDPESDDTNNYPKSDDGNNDPELDRPKNSVLDESIELQPLNGESSHKIEDYYMNKGKGIGKKTQGKENRRNSKRSRNDSEDSVSKKVKVDE